MWKLLAAVKERQQYDEKKLLTLIANGDEKAFAAMYECYRDRIYYYLLRITKSPHIAEDIIMDIFMKLWVGRELMKNINNLEAFLHKIAYTKAIDFFRTVARHSRLNEVYINMAGNQHEKNAEELLMDEECRQILLEAVNQLPPKRKLIYSLSREEGMSYEQIAKALNLSRNTIKNTLTAASRSISKYLQKHYPGKAALLLTLSTFPFF